VQLLRQLSEHLQPRAVLPKAQDHREHLACRVKGARAAQCEAVGGGTRERMPRALRSRAQCPAAELTLRAYSRRGLRQSAAGCLH
jgi:hypothetical protein